MVDGRAPYIVAFGSESVAYQRFSEWAVEIARWDGVTVRTNERVRSTRFDLRRSGTRVALEVAVEFAIYEEILRVYHNDSVWGEYNRTVDDIPA